MEWINCYSSDRLGVDNSASLQRTEFERDWDRLIFSSAFRRLQNKTQVFPLPEEVFVHNRLTHSLEVASVGRSLGAMVGEGLAQLAEIAKVKDAFSFYADHLKSVVAAACLAHDLGNPAFGHSGEAAISKYFQDKATDLPFRSLFSDAEWADLVSFEGNANALRNLTRAFKGRSLGGFRLTYATLGTMLKYPCSSSTGNQKKGPTHLKKYGYFQSETAVFQKITKELNMVPDVAGNGTFYRHPFVYLLEAADDICYNIIDLEDAHRLRIFSTEKVAQLLLQLLEQSRREDMQKIKNTYLQMSEDANEGIAYLRAKCINNLTLGCAQVFLQQAQAILSGSFSGDLIGNIPHIQSVLRELNEWSVRYIYNHPSVVKIELAGFRIMSGLIEDFVDAALTPQEHQSKMHKKTLELMPIQYRYREEDSPYEKVMCIFDFVAGMTDLYALKLYRNLRGIEIPIF